MASSFAPNSGRFVLGLCAATAQAAVPSDPELDRRFAADVRPLLATYCFTCHSQQKHEGELDLSVFATTADVVRGQSRWQTLLARVQAGEMPPSKGTAAANSCQLPAPSSTGSPRLPSSPAQADCRRPWPGVVRRLSNAEYDHTVRDLTGVDIRPTREFPVDPANEAGFDNSGESLAMSPCS